MELQLPHQSWNIQGLFYFRINWFDLLQSKGLSRLLQHHNLKASMLWCAALFMVQLSNLNPYVTAGKTTGLTMLKDLCRQSTIFAF